MLVYKHTKFYLKITSGKFTVYQLRALLKVEQKIWHLLFYSWNYWYFLFFAFKSELIFFRRFFCSIFVILFKRFSFISVYWQFDFHDWDWRLEPWSKEWLQISVCCQKLNSSTSSCCLRKDSLISSCFLKKVLQVLTCFLRMNRLSRNSFGPDDPNRLIRNFRDGDPKISRNRMLKQQLTIKKKI